MSPPRLLDLFCGAGGAAMGYHRAGFDVAGVDIEPQPRYPFQFIQADAMTLPYDWLVLFDAIHASPPCQAYSNLNAYNHADYPDLIAPVREMLDATGLPWVIENVTRAPLRDPVTLCGPMLGLKVYRHRGFELGGLACACQPEHKAHVELCARNGYLPTPRRPFMSIHGGKHSNAWQRAAADAMGVPWMTTIREVCEAIPPAYTEYIGGQLLGALEALAVTT